MSERWKPEEGEAYYFFDSALNVKSELYECDHFWDEGHIEMGNCFKTEAKAKAAAEKVKELLSSLHEPATNCSQLPKLTAEVFDRPDCPKWAKYAAVDKYKNAMWYAKEPKIIGSVFWNSQCGQIQEIPGKWDASDWQDSLIERPAKLPDWCKVGEWVYYFDEVDGHSYQKIDKIDDKYIYFYRKFDRSKPSDTLVSDRVVYSVFIENTKQASIRPYNADEMKALVGKILTDKDGNTHIVEGWSADVKKVKIDHLYYSAGDLLDIFTINGEPCGVLEHLENGEWVE